MGRPRLDRPVAIKVFGQHIPIEDVVEVSTETDRWHARLRSLAIVLASVALAGILDRCM